MKTQATSRNQTIAIDCRSLRKKPAGVPNFLICFINSLSQRKEWDLYLLSNEDFSEEVKARLRVSSQTSIVISSLPFLKHIAILWYMIKVPRILREIGPDFFFCPIPNLPFLIPGNVKSIITVHDMVFKHYPKTMSRTNWWINFFLHDRSIQKVDYLWAVSEYTRGEIEKLFPNRKKRDILVGSSVDKKIFCPASLSSEERALLFNRYGVTEKFILFVGTKEPRKNLSFLLSLMPDLADRGFSLLVVGAKGWGKNTSATIPPQTMLVDFLPLEDLVNLYRTASVFVSTSLNEGFGLPQLEAMCCGCPVLSPHNSAMIELVDGAGETVTGWNKRDWVEAVVKVDSRRAFYIERGFTRAASYDWNVLIDDFLLYTTGPQKYFSTDEK